MPETCLTCRHYHAGGYIGAGECRQRSPFLQMRGDLVDRLFPPVGPDDWCGQHRTRIGEEAA